MNNHAIAAEAVELVAEIMEELWGNTRLICASLAELRCTADKITVDEARFGNTSRFDHEKRRHADRNDT